MAGCRFMNQQQALARRLARHEGIIFMVARSFARPGSADFDDLRQELRLAAWRALQAYDPAKGTESSFIATYCKNAALSARQAARRQRLGGGQPCTSLDAPADGLDGSPIIESIADDAPGPDEQAAASLAAADVLRQVSPRERTILALRASGFTLDEVGQRLGGLSRERIRQCEVEALCRCVTARRRR